MKWSNLQQGFATLMQVKKIVINFLTLFSYSLQFQMEAQIKSDSYCLVLGRQDLHKVVWEDAYFAIDLPLPPARVLQLFLQNSDDVTLLNGQLILILRCVREDNLCSLH